MSKASNLLIILLAFIISGSNLAICQDVLATLPDPDKSPINTTKPVKVYILAGQSNMVGMGNLSGARNIYNGVYLSSDPAVPAGPFQIYKVGNYKVSALEVLHPNGAPTQEPISKGMFKVPQTGKYKLHCGFGEDSVCEMKIDQRIVYRRAANADPVITEIQLKAGVQYPFEISGGGKTAPRFWMEKMDLLGQGDLESVAKRDGKFPWLVDGEGNWTVRDDVYFQEARLAKEGKGSKLTATSNGKSIGPELGFGHVVGTFHDEQVLLIKTAQGNRSLGFDFRPPSSGRTDPNNQFESAEYRLMIEGVRKTLDDIQNVVPNYKGQGYEIAGFVWFQGHKDSFSDSAISEYEQHLVNLIKDVRKEFSKPKLPIVVATVGFGGANMQDKFKRILDAQMAVGNPQKHPEFAGTVTSVDTRGFWREVDESPANQDYHYHRNAETYMLIGDSLGRAMVHLQGGKASPLELAKRQDPNSVRSNTSEPTEAERVSAQKALRPIVTDGIAAAYIANPRYNQSLIKEANTQRPDRPSQFLRGSLFGLLGCYRAAGITEFDWRPFGPDWDKIKWEYISFDPPEILAPEKGNRFRKVTFPKGMENWADPEFNAEESGWRTGLQPFGQLDGKIAALSESCNATFCRCGEIPKTLWEKEVLLVRGTVKLPPLKKGHRYRIVLGGAAHVNSGEGFAIYINGKLAGESKTGVAVRQGGQPRGAHIYADMLEEFGEGRVTIAAVSFLRFNHPRRGVEPPRGHLTLQMEEQRIPPGLLAK